MHVCLLFLNGVIDDIVKYIVFNKDLRLATLSEQKKIKNLSYGKIRKLLQLLMWAYA